MNTPILITGTTGFLGNPMANYLHEKGLEVVGLQRRETNSMFPTIAIPDFFDAPALEAAFQKTKAKTIIHCAARAHRTNDKKNHETRALYVKENTQLTKTLGEIGQKMGIEHFIFISSVAASPFDPNEIHLQNKEALKVRYQFYGESKFLAEAALRKIEKTSLMKVTILRPPLIYGPQVKGNLEALLRIVKKGIPLPFATISSCKSMISSQNFADLILTILKTSNAWGKTYFVKDYDIPLNFLLREMYKNLDLKPRLMPFPKSFLTFLGKYMPFGKKLTQITQELVFDDFELRKTLKWTPPFSAEEEIKKMVQL